MPTSSEMSLRDVPSKPWSAKHRSAGIEDRLARGNSRFANTVRGSVASDVRRLTPSPADSRGWTSCKPTYQTVGNH